VPVFPPSLSIIRQVLPEIGSWCFVRELVLNGLVHSGPVFSIPVCSFDLG